jgi:energy-coupling factor transport system substrate-specific component
MPLVEVVLFGILGALTFGAKVVMAPLPNIEPVSLMVMLFAVVFGLKGLYPVMIYVLLEILVYGLGTWNIMYLYIWPILAIAAFLLRKMRQPLAWAMLSGAFGLLFGVLCAPVDLFIGGFGYAAAKWASGIMFDIFHCAGNFVIALLAFVPMRTLLTKLYREKLPRKYRH